MMIFSFYPLSPLPSEGLDINGGCSNLSAMWQYMQYYAACVMNWYLMLDVLLWELLSDSLCLTARNTQNYSLQIFQFACELALLY